MAHKNIRTEHVGAKKSKGFWGHKIVAKKISNKRRRQEDSKLTKKCEETMIGVTEIVHKTTIDGEHEVEIKINKHTLIMPEKHPRIVWSGPDMPCFRISPHYAYAFHLLKGFQREDLAACMFTYWMTLDGMRALIHTHNRRAAAWARYGRLYKRRDDEH